MKNLIVARRYAKALLAIAKEEGQADLYKKELAGVADLLEKNPSLKQALTNPLYLIGTRRQVLEKILDKIKLSDTIIRFLYLLFDKRRIVYIREISDFYQKLTDELANIARATVTTAIELSPETKEKIQAALSRLTGKKVMAETKVDPLLIGGVVAKIGDLILDGSIKTQLSNVEDLFRRGEKA
ncbi:MAG: ATP synthase F1 subunit delta [Pseudomonadota bacterium]